jgi:serine/threonine-protein kinase
MRTYPKNQDMVSDPVVEPAKALADRYRIERELGRGGMAVVYLAHDLRHDRPIALKVLHQELAANLGSERFTREIRLAARLEHPHILSVHDSGVAAGEYWFTMPFVEGETLRDRLRREHQLPVEDAVRIARDAALGLAYAHQHGVIHRDVKPENLLLTSDGSTLVADFGIARALSSSVAGAQDRGPEERLTEIGYAMGTPAYMSPEQATGDLAVDQRTDVYSLGCVLYEMLAGEPPFTGPTAQAILARRLSGEVPDVRRYRPSVPELLGAVIQRALAPLAADRYPNAGELYRALLAVGTGPVAQAAEPITPVAHTVAPSAAATRRTRRVPLAAVTLGLGFVLGIGILFAWRHSHREAELGATPLLAVLPFENLGAAEDDYFADGMSDEVRGKLASLPGVQVIARGSSVPYRKTTKTPQEIARELGARYLLMATVRWEKGPEASRVHVSPELVDVSPAHAPTTKWQQAFDAALTDVFQVQADIASRVVEALDVALGKGQRQSLAERPTTSLEAYDAFLRGEARSDHLSTGDAVKLRAAIQEYRRAVALDSTFAQAWAQLSRAYSYYYQVVTPTAEATTGAKQAVDRAAALAPGTTATYLAESDYLFEVVADYRKALNVMEEGLRTAPSNAELLAGAGFAETRLGRWQSGLARLERAMALDPIPRGSRSCWRPCT